MQVHNRPEQVSPSSGLFDLLSGSQFVKPLNASLTWIEGNSTSSVDTYIDLPNNYSELLIVHQLNSNDNAWTIYIPKSVLQFVTGRGFFVGSNQGQIWAFFDETKTKVKIAQSTWSGTNYFYKTTVFYR